MDNWSHFKSELAQSHETVYSVAHWLTGKGYSVTLPPRSVADKAGDWKDHADSGDLQLHLRLEVKRRQIDFTCAADFPYDDIMVVEKKAYDRANPKPFTYYLMNRAGTHAAVVRTATADRWKLRRVKDRRRTNYEQDVYHCPKELVSFQKLPATPPPTSDTQQA